MGRFPSIEDEVRLDTCYAGVPKPTFVALDGDMEDAIERARDLTEELSDAGFSPVVLRSGDEPFKVHIWVRIDNETLADRVGARGKALGFDWRRTSPIRPPFTRHYRGAQMSPLDLTEDEVVEALTTPVDLSAIDEAWFEDITSEPKAKPQTTFVVKTPAVQKVPVNEVLAKIKERKTLALISKASLDEKTKAAFRKADGQTDRSRVLLKVALGCRRNGLDWPEFYSLSKDPTLKGFSHVWAMPAPARKRAVKRAWSASEALHEEHHNQREKSRQNAALLQKKAMSEITGRGRENRILVLDTIIKMARALGSDRVRVDIRRIVEACCSHRSTVDKSVKWLCQNGWLSRLEIGEGRQASLYEIPQVTSPVSLSNNDSYSTSYSNTLDTRGRVRIVPRMDLSIVRRQAFLGRWCGRKGLGKTAGFLLEALSLLGPSSKAGWARALDRKSIAPKAFEMLESLGFVQREGKLWRTPDDLAERLEAYEDKTRLNKVVSLMHRLHEIERWRYREGEPLPYQVTPERYLYARRMAA